MNTKPKLLILSYMLLITVFSCVVYTPKLYAVPELTDIGEHWAQEDIETLVGLEIIKGYSDNTFRPNNPISRAEFMTVSNKSFGFTGATTIDFSDVPQDKWFAGEIAIAYAAGYISGYEDGTMRPEQQISRQEAAKIICKILNLKCSNTGSVLAGFSDQGSIPSWSREPIAAVIEAGYMSGYPDQSFQPTAAIRRAEVAAVMNKIRGLKPLLDMGVPAVVKETYTYSDPSTYGPTTGMNTIDGNVMINVSGITLRNTIIEGDLIVTENVGLGEVTFDNVLVRGNTIIKGGGPNSIHIIDCEFGSVIVDDVKNTVSIKIEGNTSVGTVTMNSGGKLQEIAIMGDGFSEVIVTIPQNAVVELDGTFETLNLNGEGACVELSSETLIGTLNANASAIVRGEGQIETANVNTDNVTFELTPDIANIAEGVTAQIGDDTITGEVGGTVFESDAPAPAPAMGGGGFGGGGGGGSNQVSKIESVSVSETDEKYHVSVNGTLQMLASVLPEDYENKSVTWSVNNTELASISETGLLTALNSGIVTVTATAADGSGVSGSEAVVIYAGDGTEDNPYTLYSASCINAMRGDTPGCQEWGGDDYYILMNDIDISGYSNWESLRYGGDGFIGGFDGNNHIISGLTIDRPLEDEQGLFSEISRATVQDLGLTEVDILGQDKVGALAGACNYSVISNCYVSGEVYGRNSVGGLIGTAFNRAHIYECYSTADVAGETYVGGLMAAANNCCQTTFCHSSGNVEGNNYTGGLIGCNGEVSSLTYCYSNSTVLGGENTGGIVGCARPLSSINCCYSSGDVTGTSSTTGGLIGLIDQITMSNCYSSGDVTGTINVGGLLGNCEGCSSDINSSYASGNVTGMQNTGGLIGNNTNHTKIEHCAAVNQQLIRSDNTETSFHRVAGVGDDSCLNTNYANSSMMLPDGITMDIGENGLDGQDKTLDELKQKLTYLELGWDFDTVWDIDGGNAYPALTFDYMPIILWSGKTFYEAQSDNGSIATTRIAILANETYAAGPFAEDTHYIVSNVPSGLTVDISRISDTRAAITLSGTAENHEKEDSIDNLEISFVDAAFTGGDASAVVNSSKNDLIIKFITIVPPYSVPKVYDVTTGPITTGADVWASSSKDGKLYLVPEGTAKTNEALETAAGSDNGTSTAVQSHTPGSLSTTGFAAGGYVVYAVDEDDHISSPSAVIQIKEEGLVKRVSWSGGEFTEAPADDGSIETIITVTLENETFADISFVQDMPYMVSNVPSGLTVNISRISDSEAAITLTGTADNHRAVDSISNLGISFTDDAFTGRDVREVCESSRSDLRVSFFDTEKGLTMMVYSDADNNLEPYLLSDIQEMKEGVTDDINLIVIVDRHPQYSSETSTLGADFTDTRLYQITPSTAARIGGNTQFPEITTESSYEANMADAETLKKFIDFCKGNYPADKYALIISNHGGGTRSAEPENGDSIYKAVCWDDSHDGDCMYMAEISDVLGTNQSVDLLAMDACYMGAAEIAYQYRPGNGSFQADVMVASAPAVWGDGLGYDEIFMRLNASLDGQSSGEKDSTLGGNELYYDPASISAVELGAIIVEEFRDDVDGERSDQSMSCYDLDMVEDVKDAVDALAVDIYSKNKKEEVEAIRGSDNAVCIMEYFAESNEEHWLKWPQFDLYDLCERINNATADFDKTTQSLADNVMTAVENMVVYSYGGSNYTGFTEGQNGLSIFFPDGDRVCETVGEGLPHWAYQWWYNSIDTNAVLGNGYDYGKLKWCEDNQDSDINQVGNWFEMLDAWYDASNEDDGGLNGYQY